MKPQAIAAALAGALSLDTQREPNDWTHYSGAKSPHMLSYNTDAAVIRIKELQEAQPGTAARRLILQVDLSSNTAEVYARPSRAIVDALATVDRMAGGALLAIIAEAAHEDSNAAALLGDLATRPDAAPLAGALFNLWQRTAETLDHIRRTLGDRLSTAEALHRDAQAFGWSDRDAEAWQEVQNARAELSAVA